MTHAMIRGQNGRRHEVDFGNAPVRVEVYASEKTSKYSSRQILRRSQKSDGALQ